MAALSSLQSLVYLWTCRAQTLRKLVTEMGTQSWTVGGTGSPGRPSLRKTAKAHGGPECFGLCSKHFGEITSFNSPNSSLRSVLCPHFVNEETEAQRGLWGSNLSSLPPATCPSTLASVPGSPQPHVSPALPRQGVMTGPSYSMSTWESGPWTCSTRRSLMPTAGVASPSTLPR